MQDTNRPYLFPQLLRFAIALTLCCAFLMFLGFLAVRAVLGRFGMADAAALGGVGTILIAVLNLRR